MKKIIAVLVFVLVAAGIVFAQADGMLDLNRYAEYFGFRNGVVNPASEYVFTAPREERRIFSNLAEHEAQINTPLEFALLSYYSQPVLNIRPAEANALLPANNPKLADQKLGTAVFQEIQILRFLGDTAAVTRHEAVLSFITGRGNATRQEIEAFYRNNVGGLIARVVDEAVISQASGSSNVIVPNNSITEIKQLFTSFYISPNQTAYDAIKNYITNRKLTDEIEIQRIRQMNIPGAGGDLRRRNMEIDVELVTNRLNMILLRSRIDLGFR